MSSDHKTREGSLGHNPEPRIIRPFEGAMLEELRSLSSSIRLKMEAHGIPYADTDSPPARRYNRWQVHNPDLFRELHRGPEFIALASSLFGLRLKPSYCFLSLYGPEGVCPRHVDRPQCQFTIDLLLDSDGSWPIYVSEKSYLLKPGDALCYSGTGQFHYRKPMSEDGDASFSDLVFFHFVPEEWEGPLD